MSMTESGGPTKDERGGGGGGGGVLDARAAPSSGRDEIMTAEPRPLPDPKISVGVEGDDNDDGSNENDGASRTKAEIPVPSNKQLINVMPVVGCVEKPPMAPSSTLSVSTSSSSVVTVTLSHSFTSPSSLPRSSASLCAGDRRPLSYSPQPPRHYIGQNAQGLTNLPGAPSVMSTVHSLAPPTSSAIDCVEQLQRMLIILDRKGARASSEPAPSQPRPSPGQPSPSSAGDNSAIIADQSSQITSSFTQVSPPAMSLPSLPSSSSPPTPALLASTISTSTVASLIYSSPPHPTSISSASSLSPQSLVYVSPARGSHSSPAISALPHDCSASSLPSPHVCDTTTHNINCHLSLPSSPPSSDGPSSPSNMTEHLQNLILLMEELSALRRHNSHLSEKVEYLETTQTLLKCKASMMQENCKCHNHSFELATISRKMQRSRKLGSRYKSGSDKSLHNSRGHQTTSDADSGNHHYHHLLHQHHQSLTHQTLPTTAISSGLPQTLKGSTFSRWGKFFAKKTKDGSSSGAHPPVISGPVSPVDYLGGFSGSDAEWNAPNINTEGLLSNAFNFPTVSSSKSASVIPTSIHDNQSVPNPTSSSSNRERPDHVENPSPTLSTKSEPIVSTSSSGGLSPQDAENVTLQGRRPSDKEPDAEKKRKRSNTAPALEGRVDQIDGYSQQTKTSLAHTSGPNGGSTWSRVRDVIVQTKRKASNNTKHSGSGKEDGSNPQQNKSRTLVKQSMTRDQSYGGDIGPESRAPSLEMKKRSSRSRSTSFRRGEGDDGPTAFFLPHQEASVDSSTNSSASGRGSVKISSSPHHSPPRQKRGSSQSHNGREYASPPEDFFVSCSSTPDSQSGHHDEGQLDVGRRGSSVGTASRFSSFEEPGQFVRIPMSDFDDGSNVGMPDLLRQQGTIPTKEWELMLGAHEFRRTTRRSLEGEKKDKKSSKKAEKEGRSLRDKLSSFLNLEDDFTRKMKEWERIKKKTTTTMPNSSAGCPVSNSPVNFSRPKDSSISYHYSYGALPSLPFLSSWTQHNHSSKTPSLHIEPLETAGKQPHRKLRSSSVPSVENSALTLTPDVVVGVCGEFASSRASPQQTFDVYCEENYGEDEASYPIEVFLTSGAVETCLMNPDDEDDAETQGRESETNTLRNSSASRDGAFMSGVDEQLEGRRRTLTEADGRLGNQCLDDDDESKGALLDDDDKTVNAEKEERVSSSSVTSLEQKRRESGSSQPDLNRLHISESESENGSRRGSFQKLQVAETISESAVSARAGDARRPTATSQRSHRSCSNYKDVDSNAALFGGGEEFSLKLESLPSTNRFKHLRVLNATPPRRVLKNQRKSLEQRRCPVSSDEALGTEEEEEERCGEGLLDEEGLPPIIVESPVSAGVDSGGQSDSAEESSLPSRGTSAMRSEAFVRSSRSRLREPIRLPRGSDRRAKSEGRVKETQAERLQKLEALTRAQESRRSERNFSSSSRGRREEEIVGRFEGKVETTTTTEFAVTEVSLEPILGHGIRGSSRRRVKSGPKEEAAKTEIRLENILATSKQQQQQQQLGRCNSGKDCLSAPVSASITTPLTITTASDNNPIQSNLSANVPSSPALSSHRYTSLSRLKSARELMVESKSGRHWGASGSSASPSPEVPVSSSVTTWNRHQFITTNAIQTNPSTHGSSAALTNVRMPRTYEPGTVQKLLRTFSSELSPTSTSGTSSATTMTTSTTISAITSSTTSSADSAAETGSVDSTHHPPLRRLTSRRPEVEPRGLERRYQQALEDSRLKDNSAPRLDANGNLNGGGVSCGAETPLIAGNEDAMDGEALVEKWLMRKNSKKTGASEVVSVAEIGSRKRSIDECVLETPTSAARENVANVTSIDSPSSCLSPPTGCLDQNSSNYVIFAESSLRDSAVSHSRFFKVNN